jgi:hypothetical protein
MLVGRLDHGRCVALAERSFSGPHTKKLTIVPMWACTTEDYESADWVAVHGLVEEGERLQLREVGPFVAGEDASPRADALWDCTVRRWEAATVGESRAFGPGIPLLLRAGAFAVLPVQIHEVVSVEVRDAEGLPRPTREVPMFASWFEPRVRVSSDVEAAIRALCFTAPEESDGP